MNNLDETVLSLNNSDDDIRLIRLRIIPIDGVYQITTHRLASFEVRSIALKVYTERYTDEILDTLD